MNITIRSEVSDFAAAAGAVAWAVLRNSNCARTSTSKQHNLLRG